MADTTLGAGNGDGRRLNRWRLLVWGGAGALLLLPLVAMQLHAPGVHWTGSDFAAMGALLAAAGGIWELGLRLSRNRAYRAAMALAAAGALLMTWMNLAVGIIGDHNPLNWLFVWVLALGAVGAVGARLRPLGMAAAMVAMAGGQAMIAVTTVLVGDRTAPVSVAYMLVWLAAAALFAKAAREAGAGRG